MSKRKRQLPIKPEPMVKIPKAVFSTIYPSSGPHAWFYSCSLQTLLDDPGRVFDGHAIAKESGPNIDVNRNYICTSFLDTMPDRDWLLFMDSDHKWDPKELAEFIYRADEDPETHPVVTGLYKRIDYATEPPSLAYAYWFLDGSPLRPEDVEEPGYLRIGAVPAGALLIHRSVLEKMREEFGDNWFTADNGGGMREDMSACDRFAHLKIPVHIDTRWRVTHIKSYPIPG